MHTEINIANTATQTSRTCDDSNIHSLCLPRLLPNSAYIGLL